MSKFHIPVMVEEVIKYLNVKKGHWYIDCNLGGGSHSEEILKLGGKVIGIDLDPDAINEVAKNHNLKIQVLNEHAFATSDNLILYQDNFSNLNLAISQIKQLLHNADDLQVSGILYDLGVSSYQLDTAERGFSFNYDAPLDMRMSPKMGVMAKDLIAALSEKELSELFWKLGEENFAKKIAKKIIESRIKQPIETTGQLSTIIQSVLSRSFRDRTHPATKVFQALRIAVNDELHSLQDSLPQAFDTLKKDGRLVVISFHSLEDRIVKNYFKDLATDEKAQILTDKPLTTTEQELNNNPRSRSAKLRALLKK